MTGNNKTETTRAMTVRIAQQKQALARAKARQSIDQKRTKQ